MIELVFVAGKAICLDNQLDDMSRGPEIRTAEDALPGHSAILEV